MVKGITRQAIVVKGPDPKLFDQAIFLVRDDVLVRGGISEEALLNEVKKICIESRFSKPIFAKLFWSFCGGGTVGLLWILSIMI